MTYRDEIQARLDAVPHATAWFKQSIRDGGVVSWVVENVVSWRDFYNSIDLGGDEAAADLIANAPTDLAYLLAELRSAEARIANMTKWIDEAALAIDSATIIGLRSCRPGDGLHIGNHDRLLREAIEILGDPHPLYPRGYNSLERRPL